MRLRAGRLNNTGSTPLGTPTAAPRPSSVPPPPPADVWWVFLQPMVTGGASVMIEVATGGAAHEQLPMVLRVPHHALGTNPAFAILGLGERPANFTCRFGPLCLLAAPAGGGGGG